MPRKSEYDEKVADRIIELTSEGNSLVACAQVKGIPSRTTIYKWLDANPSFADRYARAREIRADKIAEEVIDIADTEEDAQKARNRIDARKWAAGKMHPRQYGDKTIIAGTGDADDTIHIDGSSAFEQILGKLASLASRSSEDGNS